MVKLSQASGDPPNEMSALAAAAAVHPQPAGAAVLDIAALYQAHGALLGRVIRRLIGEGPPVDDVLQETFIVAFRKRAEFDGRAAVTTWLYAIAANLCMRHRRGARRFGLFRVRLADELASAPHAGAEPPDRQLERAESQAFVRAAIESLPFKQREVFVLYELESMEGAQIAELLDIPIGTVWTRLHEARKRFRDVVQKRLAREDNREGKR